MADIFISYSRTGSSVIAAELDRILRKAGWTVWFDRHIQPGKEWEPRILEELHGARCVIGLWSKSAVESPDWVTREFDIALAENKLVPVMTDGSKLPSHYQYLQGLVLHGTSKMSYGGGFSTLIRRLCSQLGLPSGYSSVEDLIPHLFDESFGFCRIGNITIPAKCILGSPRSPFHPSEVSIVDSDLAYETRAEFPPQIRSHFNDLYMSACRHFHVDPEKLRDNPLPRLDRWEQAAEGPCDERGGLTLYFSRTSYRWLWATNIAIDIPFVAETSWAETTIRKSYCCPPFTDLTRSVLANCPGVEVVVITPAVGQAPLRQVVLRRRSLSISGYRGWYQCSASGYLGLGHLNAANLPCPFSAAVAEVRQEIADCLELQPSDFRLIGLLLKEQDLHPAFFGYIEVNQTFDELYHDFRRDGYEGLLESIPFEPYSVIKHIAQNRWCPISALAMISTLRAFFSYDEVLSAASQVPIKGIEDFYLAEDRGSD